LLAALANELHFEGERRVEVADEAVRLAREHGDPDAMAQSLCAAWFAVWGSRSARRQGAIVAELAQLAATLGNPAVQFQAGLCAFLTCTGTGDLAGADEALASCSTIAAELGQPVLRWRVAYLRTHRAMAAGCFEEVERWAAELVRLGVDTGQPDQLAFAWAPLAMSRLLCGRPGEADELLGSIVANFPGAQAFRCLLAFALAEDGRLDDAARIVAEFHRGDFAVVTNAYNRNMSLCGLARAAARLDDRAAAAQLYELLLPDRDLMGNSQTVWVGPVAHDLGMLATTLHRFPEADAHFADATAVQDRIDARGTVVHTRIEWARMLMARCGPGDAEAARALLGTALAAARELHMPVVAARIAADLDALPTSSTGPEHRHRNPALDSFGAIGGEFDGDTMTRYTSAELIERQ
jgi:hypothetical protein